MWIVLLAISAAYNLQIIQMPLNVYDEGIILAGADRILKGHLPYRDFWSMYPPGQFYALALLFKLFGSSVLVERIYDLTVRSLLSIFSFLITKKLGFSNKTALISWGMTLIWTGSSGLPAYPVYPAILLIFISVYFILCHLERNQVQWLIYSGFIMTFSAMFRHDLAGMAAFVIIITLLLRNAMDNETGYRPVVYYIFAVLLAGLPISIYLINAVGLKTMINQLILTPADIIPKYRWLPYPAFLSFKTIQFYIFPFTLFFGFISSLILIIRYKARNKSIYGVFLLSLIGIFFLNQVRVRSDEIHLLPAVLISITIIPSIFSFMLSILSNIRTPKVRMAVVCISLVVISALFIKPAYKKIKHLHIDNFGIVKSDIDRAGYSSMDRDLQDLVLYIKNNSSENEAIYIGVKNHDQFIINDVIVYFLSGRQYATKYHELHPGVTDTPSIQKEIIEELRKSSVRMIVLAPRYWYEPNHTITDSRIELLDNYISENYEIIMRYGEYEVWISKA